MAFNLYADEAMQTLFASSNGARRLLHVSSQTVNQVHDYVFYFGNPIAGTKLQTAQNSGTDPVTLTVREVLPSWQAERDYGADETVGADGMIFRVSKAGKSGKRAPRWLGKTGGNTSDGTVIWRCLGRSHRADAVKLSLSKGGLEQAGSSVDLGSTVMAGAAVAVHMRISNKVGDLYPLPSVPQLALVLNESVETAA